MWQMQTDRDQAISTSSLAPCLCQGLARGKKCKKPEQSQCPIPAPGQLSLQGVPLGTPCGFYCFYKINPGNAPNRVLLLVRLSFLNNLSLITVWHIKWVLCYIHGHSQHYGQTLCHIVPPGKATPACSEASRAGFKALGGFHVHSAVLCSYQSTE